MNRTAMLEAANDMITGPRAASYGDFCEQMVAISEAFNAIRGPMNGKYEVSPQDVGLILMLMKMKRLKTGWDVDSATDIAGYAALIGENFCD